MPRSQSESGTSERARFNSDWLEEKDANGHVIGGWCMARCDHEVFCSICSLNIEIKNNGKFQLLQHAARKAHKTKAMVELEGDGAANAANNLKPWAIKPVASPTPMRKAKLRNLIPSEKAAVAEMLWCLKMAEAGFGHESLRGMVTVFQDMFPDSKIANNMNLDVPRVVWEVANGIGPFYHTKLVKNVVKDDQFYTIVYDEPVGSGVKRMDVHIRFWSEKQGRVRDHFLRSHKLFSVSPDNIRRKLMETVKSEELNLARWLMVATSGPGVPNRIYTDLDSDLRPTGHAGMIRMGSCNASVVHASFRQGLNMILHWEIDDLIDSVFRWFNKYPVRRDDVKDMHDILELKDFYIMRYAADEWAALVPLISKLVERWEIIKRYFLEVVPRNMVRLTKTQLHKSIKALLNDSATLPRILFLKSVSEVFEPFLATMQTDGLLVYTIHDDVLGVLMKLLRLFVKPDLILDASPKKLLRIDLERDSNLLKPNQMEVGAQTGIALKKLKPVEALAFFSETKKFLIAVSNSLRDKLPLDHMILVNLGFLNPSARNKPDTWEKLKAVAESMPQVIGEADIPELEEEWRTYDEDNIEDGKTSYAHIDTYWASVLRRETEKGNIKYPLLSKVVKAVLSLNQGSSVRAPVPQGQPHQLGSMKLPSADGGAAVPMGIGLEDDLRNGLKTLHSSTVQFGGTENVPITRKSIAAYMKAQQQYKAKLEAEKRAAEERANKEAKERELARPVAGKEASILLNEKANLTERVKDGSNMVARANEQLHKAVKTKNMAEILEAHELLEAGHRQITDTYQKMSVVDDKLHKLLKPDQVTSPRVNELMSPAIGVDVRY